MAVFAFGLQFGKLDLCLGLKFKLLPPGLEKSKKKKKILYKSLLTTVLPQCLSLVIPQDAMAKLHKVITKWTVLFGRIWSSCSKYL